MNFTKRDIHSIFTEESMNNNLSIERNDLCYCGSGKKYKNCCMKKDQEIKIIRNRLQ